MIPKRLEFLVSSDLPPAQLHDVFAGAGHRLYLVGGSVRDAFLERGLDDYTYDFDFATDARPDRIAELLERWGDVVYSVGATFGTIAAVKGRWTVEVTTFRNEVYRDDSRKPQVSFSEDIETDLSRRDFTVNAMALSLMDMVPIDPFGGLSDLASGVLRTPLDPSISFSEDPLRMLRLFRFQATLGFEPEAGTLAAVSQMGDRLEIVSAERIRDELSKLVVAPRAGAALAGVVGSGLADHFLPELPALAMEQDPHQRHKDVLTHTLAVVDKTRSDDLVLRLAALFHDIGKPATRQFGKDGVSFHHHEVVGARMTRRRLKALRYPRDIVDDVSRLVFLHLRPHTLKMGWTDSAVRRYVRDAGPLLDRLNELVRCDVTTANPRRARAIQNRIDELEERIVELSEKEEIARLRPPIDGHQVMAYLGIGPGPIIGDIMDLMLERRIDEGPYGVADAYTMVREWAIAEGIPDPGAPPDEEE
ncbi:MAG TPA: CCA tRNA nucleotidyltransferase [Acidimicrobiia bacterium]|nr:CCA tRNA nucleotidyltransferase [Acidimicrobiia bacterium]